VKINFIVKISGSFFYTGYIPIASGTFGSFAALLFYLIPGFENPYFLIPLIIIFTIYGIYLGNLFENKYGKDPAECTIDEAVGMWISLLFLPKNLILISITFLLWRLLDIIKPFPAKQSEAIPGGTGIMLDDIISAIYVCIIMNAANIYLFKIY
jgi:phosphatidylglycerophosphatase A